VTLDAAPASTDRTGRPTLTPARRDVLALVLLAIAYFLAAKLGLAFALVEHNVTAVWPSTGIAVVAFLLFGRRLWPAVFVAAFVVNLPISSEWWAALGTAAGNTLAPLVAAGLLSFVGFRTQLDRARDAFALVGVALLAMVISAALGTGMLVASDAITRSETTQAWLVWWTGDAMGVLIVAPVLFVVASLSRGEGLWRHWLEIVAVTGAVVVACLLLTEAEIPLLFLLLLVLGFVVWRFQLLGAAPAALIMSGFTIYAAANDLGPFRGRTLAEQMIVLQAFNASIATISLVFSAIVTERNRSREVLRGAAVELEQRVQSRTAELVAANEHLQMEAEERERAEAQLRSSERLLAQAQEIAQLGSYRWDVRTGDITWSDEMYRIHGHEPRSFDVTLDGVLAQIVPEDRERIAGNIRIVLERGEDRLPGDEYRIERPDGERRWFLGSARITYGPDGKPTELVGIVHDITDQHEAQREHLIAETLQRALLPQRIGPVPGVEIATRYLAAEEGTHAGGDWYDVIELPGDRAAFVIGDVSGHGVRAASSMGQARMTVRAYALAGGEPGTVVSLTARALDRLGESELVTLVYLELDPASAVVRLVVAGHPPPLLLDAEGQAHFLDIDPGLPLGLGLGEREAYVETALTLDPGSALFLYTDGLVDRSDLPVAEGLERLRSALQDAHRDDLERLCDEVLGAMNASTSSDDVAIACLRLADASLHLEIPADPAHLYDVRRALRSWLSPRTDADTVDALVLATSEAAANAVEHAYREGGEGAVEVHATTREDTVEVVVRDHGRWAVQRDTGRGRGLAVIEGTTDGFEVERLGDGTEVRLRRSLRSGATSER
jgi:PAS domain S-box-containing protein